MCRTPALIIGGGPAGSAAAIALARAGRDVTLIERSASACDKVCGDFVSAEAIAAIAECGVDLSALAPAPISHVRLIHGTRMATARLPFTALGLTRRALDDALLRRAESCGAAVFRGENVRGIDTTGSSIRVDCTGRESREAKAVFLATGKHNLRGMSRPAGNTGLIGLKMYYSLDHAQAAALRNHVELVLFPGGYAGLQQVENNRAVLCALLPANRQRSIDTLADECPHLAARLSGARALLDRPLAIAGLPFGYVHPGGSDEPPGLFRLGDQAAVIAIAHGRWGGAGIGKRCDGGEDLDRGCKRSRIPPAPCCSGKAADAPRVQHPLALPQPTGSTRSCCDLPALARPDAAGGKLDPHRDYLIDRRLTHIGYAV